MFDSIINFAKQFEFEPQIINGEPRPHVKKIIVAGMGGSHLSADLLKLFDPTLDIYVHRDYGLPPLDREVLKESLLIASSYSGGTEETIDFLNQALADGLLPSVLSTGGELLEIAKTRGLPHIVLPNTVIQPRVAIGLSLMALAHLTGNTRLLESLRTLSSILRPDSLEVQGKAIAFQLQNKVGLIYSSERNMTIAYNWKIKINETAKIPVFYNVFPELNHNEMAGFTLEDQTKSPKADFHCLFLKDQNDHPRVSKRMVLTSEILAKAGISSSEFYLQGESQAEKVFSSLVVADWAAYHLALHYGADPDTIPAIQDFKEKMAK